MKDLGSDKRKRTSGAKRMWMEGKDWKRVRGGLPKGQEWKNQGVTKKNRKGKVIEAMIVGAKYGIQVKNCGK